MSLRNIISAISKAEKIGISKFVVFSAAFFIGFVGALVGVISQLGEYPQPEPYIWIIQISILIVLFLGVIIPAGMALGKIIRSSNPKRSRAWKRLVDTNNEDKFVSSIDSELSDISTLSHHDDDFRFLRFWLTPNWLILISERGSVIHRRERLVRAYLEIPLISASNSRGVHAEHIYLQFDDGTRVDTRCGSDNHAKIMAILKQAVPNAVNKIIRKE